MRINIGCNDKERVTRKALCLFTKEVDIVFLRGRKGGERRSGANLWSEEGRAKREERTNTILVHKYNRAVRVLLMLGGEGFRGKNVLEPFRNILSGEGWKKENFVSETGEKQREG